MRISQQRLEIERKWMKFVDHTYLQWSQQSIFEIENLKSQKWLEIEFFKKYKKLNFALISETVHNKTFFNISKILIISKNLKTKLI